jgi:hypothetical protein
MKKFSTILLTFSFAVTSIIVIHPTAANAWLLPFVLRGAVVNTAKNKIRGHYIKCKNQPRLCYSNARKEVMIAKTRLKSMAKKIKYNQRSNRSQQRRTKPVI